MEKLSVAVITHNEEDNIKEALESVKWADEFYESNVKEIVSFCKKNKISWHIKRGTTKNTNRNGKR